MLTDLKVGTRLALAFGAVLLLLVGMLFTGVNRLSVVNEHLHAITDENNVEAREAKDIRSETAQVALVIRDLIIATESSALKAKREEMSGQAEQLQQTMSFFKNSNAGAAGQSVRQPVRKSGAFAKTARKMRQATTSVAGNLALASEPDEAQFAKFT
jgi:hypothetical protein